MLRAHSSRMQESLLRTIARTESELNGANSHARQQAEAVAAAAAAAAAEAGAGAPGSGGGADYGKQTESGITMDELDISNLPRTPPRASEQATAAAGGVAGEGGETKEKKQEPYGTIKKPLRSWVNASIDPTLPEMNASMDVRMRPSLDLGDLQAAMADASSSPAAKAMATADPSNGNTGEEQDDDDDDDDEGKDIKVDSPPSARRSGYSHTDAVANDAAGQPDFNFNASDGKSGFSANTSGEALALVTSGRTVSSGSTVNMAEPQMRRQRAGSAPASPQAPSQFSSEHVELAAVAQRMRTAEDFAWLVRDRRRNLRAHKLCFPGAEAVRVCVVCWPVLLLEVVSVLHPFRSTCV